jgi:hypothetical protein
MGVAVDVILDQGDIVSFRQRHQLRFVLHRQRDARRIVDVCNADDRTKLPGLECELELCEVRATLGGGKFQRAQAEAVEHLQDDEIRRGLHRDYFTSASIRLLIFSDRIEIISPGHLPDSLSTEQIRRGKSNRRNPTLTDHAVNILPYRGIGTGIPRVLEDWPETCLVNDAAGNEFKAVIPRPTPATPQVTPQVGMLLARIEGEMTRQALVGTGLPPVGGVGLNADCGPSRIRQK